MLGPVAKIVDCCVLVGRLKRELRHSWLSDGRRESVAEHSWSMSLLALLVHRHLAQPVETDRVLKMMIVHDLVEALAGDAPFFEAGSQAMPGRPGSGRRSRISGRACPGRASRRYSVSSMNSRRRSRRRPGSPRPSMTLEVQMQHNLADLGTWEPDARAAPTRPRGVA
jgi:putative hydrolases of HD superfamily